MVLFGLFHSERRPQFTDRPVRPDLFQVYSGTIGSGWDLGLGHVSLLVPLAFSFYLHVFSCFMSMIIKFFKTTHLGFINLFF